MKRERKNRALFTTIFIHSIFILAVLIPMLGFQSEDTEDSGIYQYVEIAFESGEMSPSSASTKPEVEKERNETITESEIEEKKVEEVQEIKINDNSIVSESEKEVLVEEGNTDDDAEESVADEVETDAEMEVSHEFGADGVVGEGEQGDAITGAALANMDFDGEGVFGRQIIYHANISKLAEQEGRVVVNLCINRAGRVTHVAFNRDASTILESSYVSRVMEVATKYRFEEDYEAPMTQCGKLTFIFVMRHASRISKISL